MRFLLTTLLTLLVAPAGSNALAPPSRAAASDRQTVLTIDDLPAQQAPGLSGERLQSLTDSLLAVLEHQQIPAVGFVNEEKLYSDGELVQDRVEILEQWLDAGIELGNHSFSHPDLHRIPLEEFKADVWRGEKVSRSLAAAKGLPYRYFRHPFLHTGLDLATKASLEGFLRQSGYVVAPVTVDNSEWIFARAFDEAVNRGDPDLQRRLGTEYVEYMMRMVTYYEDQSLGLFDREIPQILLLHANDLNAHFLESLLAALRQRGYSFIDLETALEDDAYSSPDTYVGPGGITWIHRWALTRGVERSFFDGEPVTAEWVQDLAGLEE